MAVNRGWSERSLSAFMREQQEKLFSKHRSHNPINVDVLQAAAALNPSKTGSKARSHLQSLSPDVLFLTKILDPYELRDRKKHMLHLIKDITHATALDTHTNK